MIPNSLSRIQHSVPGSAGPRAGQLDPTAPADEVAPEKVSFPPDPIEVVYGLQDFLPLVRFLNRITMLPAEQRIEALEPVFEGIDASADLSDATKKRLRPEILTYLGISEKDYLAHAQ